MNNIRPKFHITAKENWINDPNGVIKFKGRYHVFFQHHPYGINWGPMHWGHVVSDDLIHWEHLPFALVPGDSFDKDGCFSGSAFIYQDKLYLAYTGFIANEDPLKIKQQQCLAYSEDGVNFTKLGLIIGEDNLPKEYSINDFRDPCVYLDNDTFVMLVASRRVNGRGNILKYISKDLKKWEFVSDILLSDSDGIMIECPDYDKDLNLLIHCEQFQPVDGYLHHNISSNYYQIGQFNENNKFISSKKGMIDYGFDFYAPQVILEDHILIAWMDMWDRNRPSAKYGFNGSMSIPRYLEIKDNDLYQRPVTPKNIASMIDISNKKYIGHVKYGFFKLDIEDLSSLNIHFRKGDNSDTVFYLKDDKEWVFDRSKSGEVIFGNEKDEDSQNNIRRMPYIKDKKTEIYMVLDEFSIELFINGKSMTNLIYPDLNDDLLEIDIKANKADLYKYGD